MCSEEFTLKVGIYMYNDDVTMQYAMSDYAIQAELPPTREAIIQCDNRIRNNCV